MPLDLGELQPLDASTGAVFFRERSATFAEQEAAHERRSSWLVQARTAAFVGFLASLALGIWQVGPRWAWFTMAGLLAALFAYLVARHARERAAGLFVGHLHAINDEAVAREARDWKRLPLPKAPALEQESFQRPATAALVKDLDVAGPRSLYQLVCQAHTAWGRARVYKWLVDPAPPATIVERQRAAAELAPRVNFRQALAAHGRLAAAGEGDGDARRLARWAEDSPWLLTKPSLAWMSRILPLIFLAIVFAWSLGRAPASLIALAAIVNLVVSFVFAGRIHAIFNSVSSQHGEVERYAQMLDIAGRAPSEGAALARLHDNLAGGAERLRSLANLANLANLRYSPMLYFFLQVAGLWDFHVLAALERWRQRHGKRVGPWLAALGELEALASWGALAHENPGWAWPLVAEEENRFAAEKLAHPLLSSAARVANDVTVGPEGTFLLVTGSNMSGKSTLLRSIGINALLAQAGAPVCAERLAMPPLRVATSMRIQDSLDDGVSFFMAELKRLKEIVDLGRRGEWSVEHSEWRAKPEEPRLLYLLDEILQGTNTSERQIAVRQVLSHLLAEGAIGAVSTHDLALADHPQLAVASNPVHFRETLHSRGANDSNAPPMTFDYRLRPGLAPTTNALKLLELVGLGADAQQQQRSLGEVRTAETVQGD